MQAGAPRTLYRKDPERGGELLVKSRVFLLAIHRRARLKVVKSAEFCQPCRKSAEKSKQKAGFCAR